MAKKKRVYLPGRRKLKKKFFAFFFYYFFWFSPRGETPLVWKIFGFFVGFFLVGGFSFRVRAGGTQWGSKKLLKTKKNLFFPWHYFFLILRLKKFRFCLLLGGRGQRRFFAGVSVGFKFLILRALNKKNKTGFNIIFSPKFWACENGGGEKKKNRVGGKFSGGKSSVF